ncbi:MAG: hypothetical protein E7342_03795 [Clostridiales bacterium]|nr:hypothetical protein [Clostridiales bacterium]
MEKNDFIKGWEKYQAEKEKQIEKMAKRIHIATDLYYIECVKIAKYLFEKDNCRIIDKESVVLSREEYNDLKGLEKKFDDYLIKEIVATRKETAEKIFDILYQWLDLESIEKYGFVTIQKFDFLRKFREILKQFGVEIKEIKND